jgi:hypothetical protein
VSGQVEDRLGVVAVDVRLNDGGWIPAELHADQWSYQGPGVSEGTNAVEVRARNRAALDAVANREVVVDLPYDARQLANITEHLTLQRIRLYGFDFGSADKTYLELFQEHGVSQEFVLYRAKGRQDWYAEVANIPRASRAALTRREEPARTRALRPPAAEKSDGEMPTPEPTLAPPPPRDAGRFSPRARQLLIELMEELDREPQSRPSSNQSDGCCGG